MNSANLPLFPLRTVLFPGGPLPLRIFEARYLDMISRCMKDESQFGVLLLADGPEVGGVQTAQTFAIGTMARISDWYQGTDGLLGITATGTQRFRLLAAEPQADGLNIGQIEVLPPDAPVPVPDEYAGWAGLLEAVLDDLGKLYEGIDRNFSDANWLSYRFAEILPLEMDERQACLEMNDPLQRLAYLRPMLRQVREGQMQ